MPARDLAARARLVLARRPALRAGSVVALASAAALAVHTETSAARAAREAWGASGPVLVATADIAPGEALDSTNTDLRAWPVALIPSGALSSTPPGHARAAHPIASGQTVHPSTLSGHSGRTVPAGRRGVAVTQGSSPLPVRPGDHVDVVGGGAILASSAPVVSVSDQGGGSVVLVAVLTSELPSVASAVALGDVVLARLP